MPYIKLQDLFILIDTGSSQNLINKNYVYRNREKFKIFNEPFKIQTMNGESEGSEFTFIKYKTKLIKCYLYNFHKSFHILLGFNALKLLQSQINFKKEEIKLLNNKHKFNYFNEESKPVFNAEILKTLDIRHEHLNQDELNKLIKLLNRYKDLTITENEKLTFTSKIKHKIVTMDDIPIYTKSYKFPEIYKTQVDKEIDKLLNDGIIQPSYSPWNSPIWVVEKKPDASGIKKIRVVNDFRKLNDKTVDDRFPIPDITEILSKLGTSNYFTTLDLTSGFHQIEMDPKDTEKTAFSTDKGHFEYKRMPFGLKNAPATFQRLMNYVLKDLVNKVCYVYLDDIIILGTSLEEHIQNIKAVFEKLREANLKIQLHKCEFLRKEVAYLGHIITIDGIKPNPEKIKIIQNFPLPKTITEIKSFLGLLGYYRRFIQDFSKITKPFTNCLKKNSKINYETKEYQQCFEKCKSLLTNGPILQHPNFNHEFILTTDASNYALGAVLSQKINGKDLPIAYASRTLNNHEQNYSTIEKELLAIVWATKNFRNYLYGRRFKIITDHRPLIWINSLKEPNQKFIRWKIKLKEYDFYIEYKQGKQNYVADALSRIKPNFEIIYKNENIFENELPLVHCISKDFCMGKGFAEQVNKLYNTKQMQDKIKIIDNKLAIQNHKDQIIIHLLTKNIYSDKPSLTNIKSCLNKLLQYLIQNDIYEIKMPKICSGYDKKNWSTIENLIKEVFQNSSIKINIYEIVKTEEVMTNECDNECDNQSLQVECSETDSVTIHSDDESPVNGLTYLDGPVNYGNSQIIVKESDRNSVKREKLFDTKQRIYFYLNKSDSMQTILKFIKDYCQPHVNYLCLIPENFKLNFNAVLQTYFKAGYYKFVQCKNLLVDVQDKDEQIMLIRNYHEGKSIHKGIAETYSKLKSLYYFPNMMKEIQNFINKCETCLMNKYERRPINIPNILTPTADKPLQIIHLDILSLEKQKFLTIIDSFSKFAQAYKIKDQNSITIISKLIKFFSHFGLPEKIITDKGTEFNNKLLTEFLLNRNVKLHITSTNNPKANGNIERFHSSLIETIRILNNEQNFKSLPLKEKVVYSLIAYNNSIHSTTKNSPFQILLGHMNNNQIVQPEEIVTEEYNIKHSRIMNELFKQVKQHIITKKEKYSEPANINVDIPQTVYVKQHKRNSGKVEKPKYKKHILKEVIPERGQIITQKNIKTKIDQLKRPRIISDILISKGQGPSTSSMQPKMPELT